MQRRLWRAALVGVAALASSLATCLAGSVASTPATTPAAPPAASVRQTAFIADALTAGGGPLRLQVPSEVEVGARIKVVGHARIRRSGPKRAQRRTIVVSVQRDGRWVRTQSKTSDTSGRVTFSVPAGDSAGVQALRVQVAKAPGLPGVTRSVSTSVTEVGTSLPDGDPDDWTYFAGAGQPGRWDSCRPITWGYDPTHEYAGAAADLQKALADIAAQTGFTFQRVPVEYASLHVTWSRAADEPLLAGNVLAVAAPGGSSMTYHGFMRYDRGLVILDHEERDHLDPGFAGNGSRTLAWGAVMYHETLHALGLGHAAGQRQVMYPDLRDDNKEFGAGDRAGMRAIGASADCFPDPDSDLWD